MIEEFDLLINGCSGAFTQSKLWEKARALSYGLLTCMGRHTITGALTASGKQFQDWTSAYRLFSKDRIDITRFFDVASSAVLQELASHRFIVAHMDDTIIKKTGRHIPGTSWRRDPLGPAFHTNFIWGQRFLQISLALPEQEKCAQSRAIPVVFHHCPTVKKPGKKATGKQWENYKEQAKIHKLSRQGSEQIKAFREKLNRQGASDKQLLIGVDGGYTNSEVLKNLPEGVTLIGRIRKDTKLYALPENQVGVGRKRVYGERLPTPERIRQSEEYPWVKVKAWAAGKSHQFSVKIVRHVRWRSAGEKHNLQLVVIRPLGYRLTKKSKILYRKPAYLICTDPELNIETLLQAYLWRWEIEVNFREEKSLFGCGEAQIRHPRSVEKVPAFIVAIYAFLLIANYKVMKSGNPLSLPRPKWYQNKTNSRITSGDMINNLRAQLWAKAVNINFSGFVNLERKSQTRKNVANPFTSAIFYMRN